MNEPSGYWGCEFHPLHHSRPNGVHPGGLQSSDKIFFCLGFSQVFGLSPF